MSEEKLIDTTSYYVAGISLILSFLFCFYLTGEFFSCLTAATLTSGLVWGSYIIMRWLILAIKK